VTIIQSRAATRVHDSTAVKSPARVAQLPAVRCSSSWRPAPAARTLCSRSSSAGKGEGGPALLLALLPPHPPRLHRAAGGAPLEAGGRATGRGCGARWAANPGLRVAILDYFVNVSRELRNPKIIEISIFERTERSAVSDGLHRPLQPRLPAAGAAAGRCSARSGTAWRAALVLLDLDDFKRVERPARPRGGRPRADEGGGDRARPASARSTWPPATAARSSRCCSRHLAPRGVRGGGADPAEGRGALRAQAGCRSPSPAASPSFPDDAGAPADLVVAADAGLYGQRPRARTASCSPRRAPPLPPAPGAPARHPRDGGRAHPRELKNLSEGGLLVCLRDAVAVGSAVSLTIERTDATPVGLRARSCASSECRGSRSRPSTWACASSTRPRPEALLSPSSV